MSIAYGHLNEIKSKEVGYKSSKTLNSKHERIEACNVAQQQNHLTDDQKNDLERLFSKYDKPFSGKLDKYPNCKVKLDLKLDAQPIHCRPYPVARHHKQVFKDELKHLCDIGVLSPCGASQWLSPTVLIPKKKDACGGSPIFDP
jgi:hypothetical protein